AYAVQAEDLCPADSDLAAPWRVSIPIGHPLPHAAIYILDANQQPMPIGVKGEICIGGSGVARGYLNRPELTAERFISDPFASGPARLYRTGDLGRYWPDGTVELVGRGDDQVKIRGFRVEPGEVAALLKLHPAVYDAVVLPYEDHSGEKQLAAYIVSGP